MVLRFYLPQLLVILLPPSATIINISLQPPIRRRTPRPPASSSRAIITISLCIGPPPALCNISFGPENEIEEILLAGEPRSRQRQEELFVTLLPMWCAPIKITARAHTNCV